MKRKLCLMAGGVLILIATMIISPANTIATDEQIVFLPMIFTSDDQTVASSNRRPELPIHTPNSDRPKSLPYGNPVPRGQSINLPPERYDRTKHGPPLKNTQPKKNMAQNRADRDQLPERGKLTRRVTQDSTRPNNRNNLEIEVNASSINASSVAQNSVYIDWGYWITAADYASERDPSGIFASNDAHIDLVLPATSESVVLYAPTHMPPSNACLEAVTAYYTKASNTSITLRGHGFWDHCNLNSWRVFESMSQQWQNKYLRTYNGQQRFWVEIMPLGATCAIGMLYNFDMGKWETKTSPAVCGESTWDNGWTMWEAKRLPSDCPDITNIRASNIYIYNGNTLQWELLSPQTTSPLNNGTCFNSNPYVFETIHANYEWRAKTYCILPWLC